METAEKEFRIPKTVAPVICHTISDEAIPGEIFLDVVSKCTPKHIQNFFDHDALFFPIRTAQAERPLLLSKEMVVLVEAVSAFPPGTMLALSDRKKAVLDVRSVGSIHCEVLIEGPIERSRVLDVLNQSKNFVAIVWQEKFSLVNIRHILKIVEL
ncbi:hypothetical protein L0222_11110 [bacterium]|nr:hypothetical protein [bacterium]MCI0601862.1 hypothetical protein [bacterium]